MRKPAIIVKHKGGFFLALDGELNRRDLPQYGFCEGLETVKQFYNMLTKKGMSNMRSDYSSYNLDPKAIVTSYDLDDEKLKSIQKIDDIWDPNTTYVDAKTGEVIEYNPIAEREFVDEPDNTIETEIMKTKTEIEKSTPAVNAEKKRRTRVEKQVEEVIQQKKVAKAKRNTAKAKAEAIKLKEEMETINDTQWQEQELEKIEECKIAEDVQEEQQQVIILTEEQYRQLLAQQEVQDEAPQLQEASQTLNNPVNNNNMETTGKNGKQVFNTKTRFETLKKGTESLVTVLFDVPIIGSLLISDVAIITAKGFALTQATLVKPLGLHPDATRLEMMNESVAKNYNRLEKAYVLPAKGIAKVKTMALKRVINKSVPNGAVMQPQVQTA